ncbi:hypothetical protein KBK19_12000 [Microvirga sp. STR05]|uniref:DUF5034 domain-containing protein n=1 Tax=Hymenobacter duratus TaxID=2771356 RepID=A0ABR8JJH5_9BACT|nr:hypothetical protein [Hymenobacter duratus]MBD2715758.1 hypothetical protein [Hymenobacter duratus]MBR7950669.1 hypothetical protein [Microvirga sp. STR05]
MTRKLLLGIVLLVAPLAGSVLLSCTKDDGCRIGNVARYYTITGLALAASRQTTGASPGPNEPVPAPDLLLSVQLQTTYYGYQSAPSGGWLPAAYACPPTPAPGYLGTRQPLDSVVIRSRFAYDAAHPAGASLNDLLLDTETGQEFSPRGNQAYAPRLRFKTSPAQAGPQQFRVRYRLGTGEIYTAETPVLQLTR